MGRKKVVYYKGYKIEYTEEKGGWWQIYKGKRWVGRKRSLDVAKHAILLTLARQKSGARG